MLDFFATAVDLFCLEAEPLPEGCICLQPCPTRQYSFLLWESEPFTAGIRHRKNLQRAASARYCMEKRFYSHGEKGLQLVTLFEIVDLTLHALPGKACISCLQMRIMRRSIERPCPKKGETGGKAERRKRDAEAFQTDRGNGKNPD